MQRCFLFSLFVILSSYLTAQYDYFNIYWAQEPDNFGNSAHNVFLIDSNYVTIGGLATTTGNPYVMRQVSTIGETNNEEYSDFPSSRFTPNPDMYIQLPDGEYQLLESVYFSVEQSNSSTCAISHWDSEFSYLYTDTLAVPNVDTMSYRFDAMLMIDDTSFYIAGRQGYNDDGPDWPVLVDSSEKFLWKVNTVGNIIWTKKLTEMEQGNSLNFSKIYHIEGGNLLLSTGMMINGYSDHQLIKTDAEGNVLALYHWGNPTQSDGRCSSVQLPNGNVVLCYVYSYSYNPGNYAYDLDLHFMEFDPTTMLPVPNSDVNVQNDFTDDLVYIFVPEDLTATPDGGFLALMNFDFPENGDYGEQPIMMKVDSSFQLEWMKSYLPPVDTYQSYLLDVECTPDGGFIATGNFFTAVVNTQRHWLLKIDACGEVQDIGCFVGIDEGRHPSAQQKGLFQIAPNPATNQVSISSNQEFESITIRDITGKSVYTSTMNNHGLQTQVDVSMLAAGLYLIEVDFGKGVIGAQRLVVE